jgi:hypothetical protein
MASSAKPPIVEVRAWRIAWYHPRAGHWQLGVYEDRNYDNARATAAFLPGWLGEGVKAVLIECVGHRTDHGVEEA